MGQPPKAKPKRKSLKGTDKKQSARFIAAARQLGIEETGDKFEKIFRTIVPEKKRPLKQP